MDFKKNRLENNYEKVNTYFYSIYYYAYSLNE